MNCLVIFDRLEEGGDNDYGSIHVLSMRYYSIPSHNVVSTLHNIKC